MMVSGIPTASGYEERIRFAEMEIVDRQANENGLTLNAPSGHFINGWDVNVAGVRTTSVKKHLRYHTHAVSSGVKPCKASTNMATYRSTSFESNRVTIRTTSLAVVTRILYNCINGYGWSFLAKSSLHYLGRTTRTGSFSQVRMTTRSTLSRQAQLKDRHQNLMKAAAVVDCEATFSVVDTRGTAHRYH